MIEIIYFFLSDKNLDIFIAEKMSFKLFLDHSDSRMSL